MNIEIEFYRDNDLIQGVINKQRQENNMTITRVCFK